MRRTLAPDAVLPVTERATHVVLNLQGSKRFVLPRGLLDPASELVTEILVDAEKDAAFDIPLPEITAGTMERIVEYLEKHQHDKPGAVRELDRPLRQPLQEVADAWDWNYVSGLMDGHGSAKLFQVLKAAVFLVVAPLRDLCCAGVASLVRDKNEAEVMAMFGLDPAAGFDPAEEEALVRDFPWLADPA